MNTKHCGKCKKEKDINAFHRDRTKKDGRRRYCIECCKPSVNINYQRRREFEMMWLSVLVIFLLFASCTTQKTWETSCNVKAIGY